MRFAAPEHFILLLLIGLLALFVVWALVRKKRQLRRFGDLPLIMKNAPYISFLRQGGKATLLLFGLVFITLAVTRLQFGTHLEMLKREGIDLVVALDVSNSMLARDMKPTRLEKARQEIQGIMKRLKGDRIGLVAFAGEAYIQCPLTLDYTAAEFLLGAMDQNAVTVQGTSLASAIAMATRCFEEKERQHKVLLLLTDGEDHDRGAEDAAEEARREGIKIFTVGIGNPAGEPIPMHDRAGNQVGFKKDEDGNVIVTQLNEEVLQKVALATGGKYYHATAGEMELDRIFAEIAEMEKKELEGTLVTRYDDRFQWPLLFAMLLVVGEFFVSERRRIPRSEPHA